jgi:hypothetical protein
MPEQQQEHVEAAMEDILRAASELTLEDVQTVEIALQAGWLTDDERKRLRPLREAFGRLQPNEEDQQQ